MCAEGSTEDHIPLSPLVQAAARGVLPDWAQVSEGRREHIARVAELMGAWADRLAQSPQDRARWSAAAWLHDALRDANPAELRGVVPPSFRSFPGPLLHGPAAAVRIGGEADEEVRQAVCYHTLGHPSFKLLGKSLYLADFLEPGRDFEVEWRASLRERMPHELNGVLVEVLAARLRHLVGKEKPVHPETNAFWNSLVTEREK